MVSLIDIYNIKESAFSEIKKDNDPSSGNKCKNREKEFYFVDEPIDPETGRTTSKVVYKRSFSNMVKDIEAEAIDMQKLAEEHPEDMVLYTVAEELKELFNKFRTHVRKNYPDEYKKLKELNMTGTGASFSAGAGEGYATPRAFGRKGKENKATKYAKKMGYKVVDKKD